MSVVRERSKLLTLLTFLIAVFNQGFPELCHVDREEVVVEGDPAPRLGTDPRSEGLLEAGAVEGHFAEGKNTKIV